MGTSRVTNRIFFTERQLNLAHPRACRGDDTQVTEPGVPNSSWLGALNISTWNCKKCLSLIRKCFMAEKSKSCFDPVVSLHAVCRCGTLVLESAPQVGHRCSLRGSLFPVGKHVQFDSCHDHQNGKSPRKQDKEIGLALHLCFSLRQ